MNLIFVLILVINSISADDGPMQPASFSFAINQALIQNSIKAIIRATQQLQLKSENKDGISLNQKFLPNLVNMTMMLFPDENIQIRYNITDIESNLFIDEEMFFTRFEDKYGLQEVMIDKIDMKFKMNYSILTLPPIYVDQGVIDFQCEDVSFNTVWKLNLNSENYFFDTSLVHLLFQIVPEKFKLKMESYSDLTQFANKQINLMVEYTLNEILAAYRYKFADITETIVNQLIRQNFKKNQLIEIDQYLPYKLIKKEPVNMKMNINSNSQPIIDDRFFSVFMNLTLFHGQQTIQLDDVSEQDSLQSNLPSYMDNGEQLQIFIQEKFINQVLQTFYDADLLDYTIKEIPTDDFVKDYYLRIFLVNNIDTNLISIFIPEIIENPDSEFVDYDDKGRMISYPCWVQVSAFKEQPKVKFTDSYLRITSFTRLNVTCDNKFGALKQQVITLDTSSEIDYKIQITEDITVKIEIEKLELVFLDMPFSALGQIELRNIKQLLQLLSKIVNSLINSVFEKGFQLPINKDIFFYSLNEVRVGHTEGYMYVFATPNFEKIDLFMLFELAMDQINFTLADFVKISLTMSLSDSFNKFLELLKNSELKNKEGIQENKIKNLENLVHKADIGTSLMQLFKMHKEIINKDTNKLYNKYQ